MTFIEAVLKIQQCGFKICNNPDEHIGKFDVCVYDESGEKFIGKLRWPYLRQIAEVDKELIDAIETKISS